MSFLIDIDTNSNISEEEIKIFTPKKNFYCHNCNKQGHIYRTCDEPKISNGIIAFNIKNFKESLVPILEKFIIKHINNNVFTQYDYNNDIKFLMVQRKHSLGFIEFIRGKYNTNNINTVSYLIEQMIPSEKNSIINNDFDFLWDNVWNNNENLHHSTNKQNIYKKEYILSKEKFYNLKLNHKHIFKTKSKFNFNEWGFPKGRRELYEHDLICAIREFEEETSFSENNYIILDNCDYIRENLKGTNGVNYAHNYFFAIMENDYNNNDNNKHNNEIGNMQFMNIYECLNTIRPYHHNKLKIITKVYNIINMFLNEYDFEI